MTESFWNATKRRAELVGAFLATMVIDTVRDILYLDEIEPFRRRSWRRRKSDRR